jgi:cold-inducible RNA-binding protein
MAKNLYVGNMSFSTTEDQLRELFSQYGTVTKVQLIMDRETGRPRGFAFVEMSDGGDQAIAALNGTQLDGRSLTVNEAKPREDRGGGGGGRGGYGGGGGRSGGGGYGGGGGGRRY